MKFLGCLLKTFWSNGTQEQLEQLQRFTDPPVAQPRALDSETGYSEGQTKEMDRLIDTLPNDSEGVSR